MNTREYFENSINALTDKISIAKEAGELISKVKTYVTTLDSTLEYHKEKLNGEGLDTYDINYHTTSVKELEEQIAIRTQIATLVLSEIDTLISRG